jgi:hypothetical protein
MKKIICIFMLLGSVVTAHNAHAITLEEFITMTGSEYLIELKPVGRFAKVYTTHRDGGVRMLCGVIDELKDNQFVLPPNSYWSMLIHQDTIFYATQGFEEAGYYTLSGDRQVYDASHMKFFAVRHGRAIVSNQSGKIGVIDVSNGDTVVRFIHDGYDGIRSQGELLLFKRNKIYVYDCSGVLLRKLKK